MSAGPCNPIFDSGLRWTGTSPRNHNRRCCDSSVLERKKPTIHRLHCTDGLCRHSVSFRV